MEDVTKLVVEVESKGLPPVVKGLEDVAASAGKAEKATAALEKETAKLDATNKKANTTTKATAAEKRTLRAEVEKVLPNLSQMGLAVGGVAAAMTAGLIAGIRYTASIEQSTAAFKILLGSAEAAQTRLADLATFASTTPFVLTEVVGASRVLQSLTGNALSSGKGLRLVGDAAAAAGRDFQETAMWVGRLYGGLSSGTPVGEATNRLLEMGLVSGATKKQLDELATSGAGVGDAMGIMERTFGKTSGAMAEQAKTLNGLFSTLQDTLLEAAGDETLGAFTALKKLLGEILVQLGAMPNAREAAREAAFGAGNAALSRVGGVANEQARREAEKQLGAELNVLRRRQIELNQMTNVSDPDTGLLDKFATRSANPGGFVMGDNEVAELDTLAVQIKALESALAAVRGERGRLAAQTNADAARTLEHQTAMGLAEQDANKWLTKNRDTIQDQLNAYELAQKPAAERLRIAQEAIEAEENLAGTLLNTAQTQAERDQIRLASLQKLLGLKKDEAAAQKEIAADAEKAADADERKRDKLFGYQDPNRATAGLDSFTAHGMAAADSYMKRQAELDTAFAERLISEQEYQQQSEEAWKNYEQRITSLTEVEEERRRSIRERYNTQVLGSLFTTAQQGLQIIEDASEQGTAAARAAFVAGKALAVAQIIINTEVAAARALAELGTYGGSFYATAIRVAGYASAAMVGAQTVAEFSQHDSGGMIGSGRIGIVGENGPELIHGPMNVTSRKATADLLGAASGGGVAVADNRIVVNNYSSAQVDVREQRDAQGSIIEIVIKEVTNSVAGKVRDGGNSLSRAFESTYGLKRQGV